jgi:hypothetical protein
VVFAFKRGTGIGSTGVFDCGIAATGTVAHSRCDDPGATLFDPMLADIPIGRST